MIGRGLDAVCVVTELVQCTEVCRHNIGVLDREVCVVIKLVQRPDCVVITRCSSSGRWAGAGLELGQGSCGGNVCVGAISGVLT